MLCDKNTSENRILKGKDVLENNPFVFQVRRQSQTLNVLSEIIELLMADLGPEPRSHILQISV